MLFPPVIPSFSELLPVSATRVGQAVGPWLPTRPSREAAAGMRVPSRVAFVMVEGIAEVSGGLPESQAL